jgi:hypothetical protein
LAIGFIKATKPRDAAGDFPRFQPPVFLVFWGLQAEFVLGASPQPFYYTG